MKGTIGSVILCLIVSLQALAQNIQLPAPHKTGGMPLMEALNARQTKRTFSSKPLSEQQLSDLLWAAFGMNRESGKRTAPSAMNRQEIDLYVALSSGLYLYDAKQNALTQILGEDIRDKTGKQSFVKTAPVCLVYVSDDERLKMEFYTATDTGFISQNVYLFCASEGLNTVVLGSVDKDALHAAMKLKPTQHVILTQPVGLPPDMESKQD
ncbi:MAG: SagB/ThcOx family dehydrogenase [Kiritimatiellales bacterium]|nr:SagB/ThcOx family dehydrogenase [Kiritimatiellales bacterium]